MTESKHPESHGEAPRLSAEGREREDMERFQKHADQQISRFQTPADRQGELHGGRFSGKGPKGYRRSDERIYEEACDRLTEHPEIDATNIEVKVQDGEVTLTGSVDERRIKRLAEDVVDGLPGVKDVHNQLRVLVANPSPTLENRELHS